MPNARVNGRSVRRPPPPQANPQKNKAPEPFGSGAKFGGGRSPRALSHHIRWAHSLSRAVCSPTPLFAACEVFDLMAGSLLPLPIGVYRVRPLRPVRPPPARGGTPDVVQTRLQVADLSRRHRCHGDGIGFWPIVCPALRVWPLNSQAAFALQLGDVDLTHRPIEEFSRDLPGPLAPRGPVSLARPVRFYRIGPFGGVVPPGNATAFWSAQ